MLQKSYTFKLKYNGMNIKEKLKLAYINTVYHRYVRCENILRKRIKAKADNKFLFVLSPQYSGSTLLTALLLTSKNVSVNNKIGAREGQQLPVLNKLLFNNVKRWEPSHKVNWSFVKKQWLKYWDVSKPILLEKSPPNLVRAKSIEQYFAPSYFIVLTRNPYSLCQSLIKRSNFTPEHAAQFTIKCLLLQKHNIETLNNVIKIAYEEMVENTNSIVDKLKIFIPELGELQISNVNAEFGAIANMNNDKIKQLSAEEINIINNEFVNNKEVLEFFGYRYNEKESLS